MRSRWSTLLATLLALTGALALAHLLATLPPPVVLGALFVPVLAAVVLVLARRRDGVPLGARLATFAWGALGAALLSSAANDALSAWVAALTGEEWARRLVPALGGPVVEELTKAAGLVALVVLVPRAGSGAVEGMVSGALVGLGFTAAENVGYLTLAAVQGGSTGLERAFWVRTVLGGFTHAVFTATTGAGLGWAPGRQSAAWWLAPAPVIAVVLATLQHALWNVLVSPAITQVLCNPAVADGRCREAPEPTALLVTVPLVAVAGLAPGVAGLAAAVAWARRRRAL